MTISHHKNMKLEPVGLISNYTSITLLSTAAPADNITRSVFQMREFLQDMATAGFT